MLYFEGNNPKCLLLFSTDMKKHRVIKPSKVKSLNTDMATIRPICKECNKNFRAVNYIRDGVIHYRSICDDCGKKKPKKKSKRALWEQAGYKKKPTCDICGFRSLYPSQLTVFHIDGDLRNTNHSNLRSICLNCVEVVKRKEVTWKRGDLQVDY